MSKILQEGRHQMKGLVKKITEKAKLTSKSHSKTTPPKHKHENKVTKIIPGASCANCLDDSTKIRRRDFSQQALAILVMWDEIRKTAIDEAICDSCYDDLREVLIERASEIEFAINTPEAKSNSAYANKNKKHKKLTRIAS